MDRLKPALQRLLVRAVDDGCARDDVTAREVLMTIALHCQPVPGEQPSFNQRMTRPFMAGLGRVAPMRAAFSSVGWGWGGDWAGSPDYQHFSVNGH
jgi:D-alanyl-D-alanine carboxypeptidase